MFAVQHAQVILKWDWIIPFEIWLMLGDLCENFKVIRYTLQNLEW